MPNDKPQTHEKTKTTNCSMCGEPMPKNEEMFQYHGYSGPCPKPPLKSVVDGFRRVPIRPTQAMIDAANNAAWDGDEVVVVEVMYQAMLNAAPEEP